MLHADFRRHAHLFRARAQQFGKPCRRHRTGDAHFALAAHFGAGDRGVHLIQRADSACRQEVADVNIGAHRFDEVIVVGQHRGHNAAGAVGRRGHHAWPPGVLFVHGKREHIHPVHHVHRIAGELIARHQQAAQRGGTTRHTQRARKHAFRIHAAINTGAHGLPDVSEIVFDFFFAVQRQLIFHDQPGERQAGLFAVRQQIFCRVERIRHTHFIAGGFAEILFVDDKTAADGIIGFAVDFFVAAVGVDGHAVLMQRQVVALKPHAIVFREIHFVATLSEQQTTASFHVPDKRRYGIDIHCGGFIACQAHNNGDIRMVAFAGQ
ncbi:hypothetical protein BN135_737 [Cronobacter muytjensii 530]